MTPRPERATAWIAGATALLVACASTGQTPADSGSEPHTAPGGQATLVIANPTADSWDLRVDGTPRGSIAPRSEAHVTGLAPHAAEVVATNVELDLVQRGTVTLVFGEDARFALRPMWASLVVHNAQGRSVEIAVDGAVLGRVETAAEARFERVPAGRRMILARVIGASGAVRAKTTLTPDAETRWEVPALDIANPIASEAPKPPAGQGLVWMHNAGRHAVQVTCEGAALGRVAPGGTLAIVLAPGTHVLRADLEGLEAHTEESVTLLPNQIAEWVWSE